MLDTMNRMTPAWLRLAACTVLLTLLTPAQAMAGFMPDYERFFAEFRSTLNNKPRSLGQHYAADARVKVGMDDGRELTSRQFDGKSIDQVIKIFLNPGTSSGADFITTKPEFRIEDGAVTITSTRTIRARCYDDTGWTLVIARDQVGQYQVVEETMRIPSESRCKGVNTSGLVKGLQLAVSHLNVKSANRERKQATWMDQVTETNVEVTFHHKIRDAFMSGSQRKVFGRSVRRDALAKVCFNSIIYRNIIDHGRRVTFSYTLLDGTEITKTSVGSHECLEAWKQGGLS